VRRGTRCRIELASEGLDLRIAPAAADAPSTTDGTLTHPVSVQGRLMLEGQFDPRTQINVSTG